MLHPAPLLACLVLAAPITAQLTDQQRKSIDELFKPFDQKNSPGASVAVIRAGDQIFAKAWGSAQLEYEIPNTPSTIFHVASVTKQFTAFALVLLAQEGKLTLEDDIRKHLPWMHDFGKTITIRHLLTHTSGLRDQWELLVLSGYRMDDVLTKDHIMRILSRQRDLNFEPGSRYLYCNSGYTLAADIVGKVSGQKFEDFCAERIFKPLGMARTHMQVDHRRIVPGRSYSYERRGKGWRKRVLSYANAGATSLFTTAPDLTRWLHNFATGKVGGTKAVEAMNVRGVLTSGKKTNYALGVVPGTYRDRPTVSHGGADAGFRSHALWFPNEKLGIAIVANLANINTASLARRVADIVLGLQPAPSRQPGRRQESPKPNPGANLKDYVGRYFCPELEVYFRIGVRDGRAVLRHRRLGGISLIAVDEDRLQGRVFFARSLAFERVDGKVTGFRLSGSRVLNLRFERMD